MFPLDYLLAAALLAAPPDCPVASADVPFYLSLGSTMQSLGLEREVLDRREEQFMLTRGEDFADDLKLLRQRHADLLDAPPLYDCQRFPDRSVVSELLTFNRAYRQNLDNRLAVEASSRARLEEAIAETDHLYQIWDAVRDTRCDYYYINVRRQALKRLRDLIGEQAYYTGSLPPHVPVWRFQRID
jgi:hypothetical protein